MARRPEDKKHAGLWEFPGGKFEAGERLEQALFREIYEELGLEVDSFQKLMNIRHQYPDYAVCLRVALVTVFSGQAHGKEGQLVRWVPIDELAHYSFPEANTAIVQKLSELKF